MPNLREWFSILGAFIEREFGLTIKPELVEWLVVTGAIVGVVVAASNGFVWIRGGWYWLRRRLGDKNALPEDQLATVEAIEGRFIEKFAEGQQKIVAVDEHLQALAAEFRQHMSEVRVPVQIQQLNQVAAISGEATETIEPELVRKASKIERVESAKCIRDVVMRKFHEVIWFDEVEDEPHSFRFEGAREGIRCEMWLTTPYYNVARGGDAVFALHIWIDRKKMLNCFWDNDEFWLKRFIRADWEEAVMSWKYKNRKNKERKKAAEETRPPA